MYRTPTLRLFIVLCHAFFFVHAHTQGIVPHLCSSTPMPTVQCGFDAFPKNSQGGMEGEAATNATKNRSRCGISTPKPIATIPARGALTEKLPSCVDNLPVTTDPVRFFLIGSTKKFSIQSVSEGQLFRAQLVSSIGVMAVLVWWLCVSVILFGATFYFSGLPVSLRKKINSSRMRGRQAFDRLPRMSMLVLSWLLLFPTDVLGSMERRQQSQQRPGKDITRGVNDGVSLAKDREFIRSKGGPVEERSRPHRRRLTEVVYQGRTSGICGYEFNEQADMWQKVAGEGIITSAAACEAAAAAWGWGDMTARTESTSRVNLHVSPHGCFYSYGGLYFNTNIPNPLTVVPDAENMKEYQRNYHCSSYKKCLCTSVCPSGTCENSKQQYPQVPDTRSSFAYNKQQYPQVPATLHTKYKRVPASLFNTFDEENEKIDLDEAKETCEMYDMAKITSREECVRAAQELGYCGNIEQYFVQRNATGHIQIKPTKDIPKPIVTTEPTTWRTNVQCETCPDYLNQKITGTVLQGELFDSENCNATTARVIRKMNVNECQRSFHDEEEEAFSWKYSCNAKGDVVEVTPYPAGVGDCTGKPTSFDQGVWKSFAEMDKVWGTKTFADTFFDTIQPVIALAQHYDPFCTDEGADCTQNWLPTNAQSTWNQCITKYSAKQPKFWFQARDYQSLNWKCYVDEKTGKNPTRICGNATNPPEIIWGEHDDTHMYPHEDIWPAGCFVHEGISTGTERQKVATLVFNDNFESEALCKDNGQVIGSMRCLCRPKTASESGLGYDANAAELKARGLVLNCMPNGWCGYVDQNVGSRTMTNWLVLLLLLVATTWSLFT